MTHEGTKVRSVNGKEEGTVGGSEEGRVYVGFITSLVRDT